MAESVWAPSMNRRYRGTSERRSLPGAVSTASVPCSTTSTMGHGLGFRAANARKSEATARGNTTRLACTHSPAPYGRWARCAPQPVSPEPRPLSRNRSARVASLIAAVFEDLGQGVQERRLPLVQLRPSRIDRPPGRLVYLRVHADLARARRPFELEGVADRMRRGEVPLKRPCADPFAARLAELAEKEPRPVRRRRSQLLLELPQSHGLGVIALVVLAFGNRPGMRILSGPEGPTGMHQQHFDLTAGVASVKNQAGAPLVCHACGDSPGGSTAVMRVEHSLVNRTRGVATSHMGTCRTLSEAVARVARE